MSESLAHPRCANHHLRRFEGTLPLPLSPILGFPPGSALLPGWGEAGGAGGTPGAGPYLGSILLGLGGGLLLGAEKRGGGVLTTSSRITLDLTRSPPYT